MNGKGNWIVSKSDFKDWNSFEMQFKKQCVMPEQSQTHTGVTHSACLHRKKSFAVNCEKMLVANLT